MARTRKPLWHLRWQDVGGCLGLFMVVPQVIDRYTTGQAADPWLAGIGASLVLAASGYPRALELIEGLARRRSGRAE